MLNEYKESRRQSNLTKPLLYLLDVYLYFTDALVNITTRFKNETFSKGLLQNGSTAFKSLESKIHDSVRFEVYRY